MGTTALTGGRQESPGSERVWHEHPCSTPPPDQSPSASQCKPLLQRPLPTHTALTRALCPSGSLQHIESGLGSSFFNLLLVPGIELNLSLLSPLGVIVQGGRCCRWRELLFPCKICLFSSFCGFRVYRSSGQSFCSALSAPRLVDLRCCSGLGIGAQTTGNW